MCVGGGVLARWLHRYSSKPLQILENGSGEAGMGRKGKAGEVPVSPLAILGCCCVGAGELRGKGVAVAEQ